MHVCVCMYHKIKKVMSFLTKVVYIHGFSLIRFFLCFFSHRESRDEVLEHGKKSFYTGQQVHSCALSQLSCFLSVYDPCRVRKNLSSEIKTDVQTIKTFKKSA